MKTIYKYELKTTDTQSILVHKGAKPLAIQLQNGIPHIWLLIDIEANPEFREIRIYGTGHPITDTNNFDYLGTYQYEKLVFHAFIKNI